jgi:uncharacterized membrane protein
MRTLSNHPHQQGSVIFTVSLVMLFLLALMGIAMDFGGIFIVKSDLQVAINNCALAAAKELDGQSTALMRAASAGQTAGNLNNENSQSSTLSSQVKTGSTEITFKDASYMATTVPTNAKYAQCQHTQSKIGIWLLQFMDNFSKNTVHYPNGQNTMVLAVAARVNAQITCPTPVTFKSTPTSEKIVPDEVLLDSCATSSLTGGATGSPLSTLVQ